MNTRIKALLVLGLLGTPLLANATVIFSDDFEGTGATTSDLNWDGGDNWNVEFGTVDLVKSGQYGITCSGGTGFCIDMDGSTNSAGEIVTINLGPLGPGTYTFSYDLSGNQRRATGRTDSVVAYVEFGHGIWLTSLAFDAGWQTYSHNVTLTSTADPVELRFAATGGDNIGMMLDNVSLVSVPEPGTLALLGLGLAGLGFSRRNKA